MLNQACMTAYVLGREFMQSREPMSSDDYKAFDQQLVANTISKFQDYTRVGLPLQAIILFVAVPMIMWVWPPL